MTPYIVLFIAVILLMWWDRGRNLPKSFGLSAFFVFLIFALRNKNVGSDTENYVKCWNDAHFYYTGEPTDIGFETLLRFFHIFGSSNIYFFIFIAVVTLAGLYYFINKNSKYRVDSIFFFCTAGTVFIFMLAYICAVRQAVAMSFYLFGLTLYFDETATRKQKFLAWALVLAAVSIHGSCAVVIPVMLMLPFLKLNKWVVTIAIGVTNVLGALGVFQLSSMLTMIDLGGSDMEKYQGYTNEMTFGQTENVGIFNFFLLPYSLILIYLAWFKSKEELNSWSFKYVFVGMVLTNLMVDNLMWGRLLLYFTIVSIVVFPNMLRTANFKYKNIVYLVIMVFFVRKVVTGLAYSAQLAIMNFYNTEVPYETWLISGGAISVLLLYCEYLHRVEQRKTYCLCCSH